MTGERRVPAPRPVAAADGERRGRLRLLTLTTVATWLVALAVTGGPAMAAGTNGTSPDAAAHAQKSPAAASPTPKPTKAAPTPQATSGARATPKPKPTPKATHKPQPTAKATQKPQPTPKATQKPQPTPKASNPPGSSNAPTARPTSNAGGGKGGGGAGGGSQGSGGSAATHRPGTAGTGGGASPGGSQAAPVRASAPPDVFAVTGAAPLDADGPEGASEAGSDQALQADIHLDFRWDASLPLLAPAALFAMPAFLIVVSLLAQLATGVLWIPVTGRVLGPPAARDRRDRRDR